MGCVGPDGTICVRAMSRWSMIDKAVAAARAHVVSISLAIACDIHPLNNLRVLNYLKNELGHSQDQVDNWYRHWITTGLPALEAQAKSLSGAFLFGDGPTAADVCLVPQ